MLFHKEVCFIISKSAYLIEFKVLGGHQIGDHWPVPKNLFLDLSSPFVLAEGAAQKVRLLKLCDWLAMLISRAGSSFSLLEVWSAGFANQVAVLGEVPVEERPATFAPFIHVIAGEQELHRHLWNFISVPEHEPRLYNLYKTGGVARSTCFLVTNCQSEVKTLDVLEGVSFRNFVLRNIVSICVILRPLLSFFNSFQEPGISLISEDFSLLLVLSMALTSYLSKPVVFWVQLCEHLLFSKVVLLVRIITNGIIVCVTRTQLTDVSPPPQSLMVRIDPINELVSRSIWFNLSMRVETLELPIKFG